LAGTLFPVVNSTSASPNESPFSSPSKEKPSLGDYEKQTIQQKEFNQRNLIHRNIVFNR